MGRLGVLRQDDAGLEPISGFFTTMAHLFRSDPARHAHGCLMVNTLAELGARDPRVIALETAYRDGVRDAFASALRAAAARGEVDAASIPARAALLATLMMGLFLTARLDPTDAAGVCEGVAAEVSSWRLE